MKFMLRINILTLVIMALTGGLSHAASISVDFEPAFFIAQESGSSVLKIKLTDENGKGIPGRKIYIKSSAGQVSPVEDIGNGMYTATLIVPEQAPPRLPGYVALVVSADLNSETPTAGAAISVLSNLVIKGYASPGVVIFARADGLQIGKEVTAGKDGSYTLVVPLSVNAKKLEIVPKGRRAAKAGVINLKEINREWIVMQAAPDELTAGESGTLGAVNIFGIDESGKPIDISKLQLSCSPGNCSVLRQLDNGLLQAIYTPPAVFTSGQAVLTATYGNQSYSAVFKLVQPELSKMVITSDIVKAKKGDKISFEITSMDEAGGAVENDDIDVFINGVNMGKAIPGPNGEGGFIYEVRPEDAGGTISVYAASPPRGGAGSILKSNSLSISVEGFIVTSIDDETKEIVKDDVKNGTPTPVETAPPEATPVALTISASPESGQPGEAISLTANLLDENGARVTGKTVVFQSAGGIIGGVGGDAAGDYKATLAINDNAAAGKIKVEATCVCGGKNLSANADVEVLPLPVATIELSSDQSEIYVTENIETSIEATVKNRRGEGVQSEPILLTLKDGQKTKTATLNSDSQGKVRTSFQLVTAEGNVEVEAVVRNTPSITGTLSLKKILYNLSRIVITPEAITVPADGASTVEFEIQAINEAQNDAFNETLNFTLTGGGRLRSEFVTTGMDGRVSQYYSPGLACGTAEILAYSKRDTTVKKTILIKQTPAIPAKIDLVAQTRHLTADGMDSWDMTVLVTDAGGCPVAGEELSFQVLGGLGAIESEKTTDVDGKAVAHFAAGLSPGIAMVLVTSKSSPMVMLSVDINLSNWVVDSFDVSPSSMSVKSGQPFVVTLTAKDKDGRAVTTYDPAGKTFQFSGPAVSPEGNSPAYPSSQNVIAAFKDGVASVEITLYKAETVALTVTDGGASGVSGAITVLVSSQPWAAINSPLPGSWQGLAGFNADVTNNGSGGALLASCEYRSLSAGAETSGWKAYPCASDPAITVGVAGNCRNEGANKCEIQIRNTDEVANTSGTVTRSFSIDFTKPVIVINGPAAIAWQGLAGFTADVTNSDAGGSGLSVCEYRVVSSGSETSAWAPYICSSDLAITVGAAADCRNEGADKCLVQFRTTDIAGNTSDATSRLFSIDYSASSITINSPAAGSWQRSDFTADVTNTDAGGAGLATCEYRVVSNGVQTIGWISYACSNDPVITVGAAANCKDEGINKCSVEIRNTDAAGNTSAVIARSFSIDFTNPGVTINSPAASSWRNADFTADVTNADTGGSGLFTCEYRVVSNGVQTLGWTSYACSGNPLISVGAAENCKDEGPNKCSAEYRNADIAGNTSSTSARQFSIDFTNPSVTINSPAASSWRNADFTADVTNTDTGGSSLATCEYRVLSAAVQTVGWTSYTCSIDPVITVGATANCHDEGADKCEAQYRSTDAAGNNSTVAARLFSIHYTAPEVAINSPAASSWQKADFTADVTNTDTIGAGLASCEYRVLSNAVQTLGWTSYTCLSAPVITVGAAANCRDEGADRCEAQFRNADNAGNTSAVASRLFSIDFTNPSVTINAPAASSWQKVNFTIDVTNTDIGGSALATCEYRVLSNAVQTLGWTSYTCSSNPTITVGAAANCRNEGVGKCSIEFRNTDASGNTSVATSITFSIDFTAPTIAINNPAASSTQSSAFILDVTNADAGGSGLNTCSYTVYSNGSETLAWTVYSCTDVPQITVGAGQNCRDQGADACEVRLKSDDSAGNNSTTQTRAFTIDLTPPSCSISGITEDSAAACQYVSGATIYYNNNAACSGGSGQFTVDVNGGGGAGAVVKVNFPATVSAGGDDFSAPYLLQYTYDAADAFSNTATVTIYNDASRTNTCSVNVTRDIAAPSGGAVSYTDGWHTSTSVSIALTNGADGLSGISDRTIERQSAALSGGSCGAFGAWGIVIADPPALAYTDATVSSGNCYSFRYVETDRTANQAIYTSASVVKVDSGVPAVTINSPAASSWQKSDFTADVTNTDTGGSGLATCEYRVLSNAVQTLGWTAYTCATDPTITVGAAANCRNEGADKCEAQFRNADAAGNTSPVTLRTFSIDYSNPTVTINSPSASSWQKVNFTTDVTNTDSGGSALATCEYRVLSNAVQTLGWTTYTCSNDPTITVGSAANCLDEGADKCSVEFRNTDTAGNTSTTATRNFSIDFSNPTVTINSPAASSWQRADFTADVTNADTGGSALATCEYRVLSNAVQTLGWTTYTCSNDPTITVGAAANCLNEGADKCSAEFRNTDTAGNTSTTATRNFSIDFSNPTVTINSPAASSWHGADFTADVTNADTGGSALATCEYRVLSNAVQTLGWTIYTCSNDPTITVGAVADCMDEGADLCETQFRNTDAAGNTSTTVSRTFSIDLTTPSCLIAGISRDTSAECQYVTGSTIYYNNNASCSAGAGDFTISVSDTGGVSDTQKLNFPATVAPGGDDLATPFLWQYLYDSSDTFSGAANITIYNNAARTNTCQFTVTRDVAAPDGGSESYTDGWYIDTSVDIALSTGSDALSGIDTGVLERQEAVLGGGVCGAFGAWVEITVDPSPGTYTDATAVSGNCYIYRYLVTDLVGNQAVYTSASVAKIDAEHPTVVINSPVSGSWQGAAGFTLGVTNSDSGGGSLVSCEYRALSNGVETVGWTAYVCAAAPSITVGAAANCKDEGVNTCEVQVRNTDTAGNVSVTMSSGFSIDFTKPDVTINSPAASSWQGSAGFTADVTNSDAGGSGLSGCEYRVESNGVETVAWTVYACSSDPIISAGSAADCRNEGADKCLLQFRITDGAGNISNTTSRSFSIDFTNPSVMINAPTASSWQGAAGFTADVTNSDTGGAGLSACEYRVLSNSVETLSWTTYVCAVDPAISVGAAADCRNEGADKCEIQFRNTDAAGNTSSTVSRLFSIDFTGPAITINSPAASGWHNAGFTVNLTNSDGAGAGLSVCSYRVLNGAAEIVAWTVYACASNPSLTVGAASDCRTQGTDQCEAQFKSVDAAGNTSSVSSRLFSIDYTAPDVTINNPAAGSTQSSAFTLDVTNSDTGGSGLNTCSFTVLSNGMETLAWTVYSCADSPQVTVGAGENCRNAGANSCEVQVKNNDVAGNNSTTQSRFFTIDLTPPSCSISGIIRDSGAACQYVAGAALYYNNNASCSGGAGQFTVGITGGGGAGNIDKVSFPPTVSAGGDDLSAPYSFQYTYDSADTFSNTAAATIYNDMAQTNNCSFNAVRDIAAPAGGAVSYTDGYYVSTSVGVTLTNGSDALSGVSGRALERQGASLAVGSCGAYGAWGVVATDPPSSSYTDSTVSSGSCYKYRYVETDRVGNQAIYTSASVAKISAAAPFVTINSPAASSWQKANFTADVTNTDNSGSGLAMCEYRVLSNSVQTLGWTAYACATDPTITVGAAANCRNEGADKCAVEFRNTDTAGNTSTTAPRNFSIDFTAPSVTINSPAASSWQMSDFTANVTNADTGGSGLSTCEHRVLSNAVQTLGWTTYACAASPAITVGAAANCRNEGADKCSVEFRNTDAAGNISTTSSRLFSIDFTAPATVINSPAASSWLTADFTVDVTNTDTGGSGLSICEYRVLSNGAETVGWTVYTCAVDQAVTVGAGQNCLDEGADKCQPQFRNTDAAGNISTAVSRTFSIDYTAPDITVNSPADSSWQRADFALDVTNADTGGSGLSACSYRVLSNGAQTLASTAYACGTDPVITAGAGANCRDQDVDMCEIQLSAVDIVGNTSITVATNFSIDFTNPTVTINSPAAGSSQSSAFMLNAANADTGGSDLDTCSYRVLSNAIETLAWTAYTCDSFPQITVGTGLNCRDAGTNKCEVQVKNTDAAGNTSTTATRQFTINLGPLSCYISGITKDTSASCQYVTGVSIYYNNNSSCSSGTGMFTVSVAGVGGAGSITKVNFPNTVSTGGDDTTSPYSKQYTYNTSDSYNTTANATIYNDASQTNTCGFSVKRDTSNPSKGSIRYTSAYYTSLSVAITLTNGTDSGSGIATRVVQRQSATLSAGSCGSYGSWSNVVTNPPSSTYNDTTVTSGNCFKFRYVVTDNVGNSVTYTTTRVAKVDASPPVITINSPAAGSWQKSNFTADVTNTDTGGSGLSTCKYRVLSNGSQTLGWTSYTCSTDPSITVGAGLNCRDSGVNKCEVQFSDTDAAGGTSAATSRLFSIDITAPTVTINSPAASSWQGAAGFVVDATETDGSGSGLATCEYRVRSSGNDTVSWAVYTCGSDRTLTVGAAANCRNEGGDKCEAAYRATDLSGNISSTVLRLFNIDFTLPVVVINSPAAGSWQTGNFVVNTTSTDSGGSSLATCQYQVLSNSVVTRAWTVYTCNGGSAPSITAGTSNDCRDSGANICEVQLRAADNSGNISTTASRLFSIDPIVFGGGGP